MRQEKKKSKKISRRLNHGIRDGRKFDITTRPTTEEQLQKYIRQFFGLTIPLTAYCHNHQSPMDYLWYNFNVDFLDNKPANCDSVLWANRGGGKTMLTAIGMILDCIFKPKCEIKILSGSGYQAGLLYDYARDFLANGFDIFIKDKLLKTGVQFKNGSSIGILMQSESSVRGPHIQKLKCDEVELFDTTVWNAAKFMTMSKHDLIAGIGVLSTLNNSYGLMRKLLDEAVKFRKPIFKWCLWDVIEKCNDRDCNTCLLVEDCKGKAKTANGYYSIDDAITIKQRSPARNWRLEMLCEDPKTAKSKSEGCRYF